VSWRPLAAAGATALLAAAGVAGWLGSRPPRLPVLGSVPPFSLTDRSGRTFTADDLTGSVWVVDFIFTRCPDVCPALTAQMARLGDGLRASGVPVRRVSISVDPVHDTPEVLHAYAARAGAPEDWLFLTGRRNDVATLLRDGFRLAFADGGPPASPITHSDRFVLVDRRLRIRGYYHGADDADLRRLVRDTATLRDG
jgi:protein SCO1/2